MSFKHYNPKEIERKWHKWWEENNVNGKVRDIIKIEKDTLKDEMIKKARSPEIVKGHLDGKLICKEIYVPHKIINFVLGDQAWIFHLEKSIG